jgi:hypothetical protein
VSESRLLRRIFRPDMRDVTGEWKKLHDDINTLHVLPDFIIFLKGRPQGHSAAGRIR